VSFVQGQGKEDPAVAAVRKLALKSAAAFNGGKVDELAAMFLPQGEFIQFALSGAPPSDPGLSFARVK
jgi:hypothetical protein